jgi:hypothetical protein
MPAGKPVPVGSSSSKILRFVRLTQAIPGSPRVGQRSLTSGVLGLVVVSFYVWAGMHVTDLRGRTITTHSVAFSVPFPLTDAEDRAGTFVAYVPDFERVARTLTAAPISATRNTRERQTPR